MNRRKGEGELEGCSGCLSHLRTPDGAARRALPAAEDDDGWLQGLAPPYDVDAYAKLLPSKALRRLACKTQVVTAPDNLHIRSRLVHTMEVAGTAALAARLLGLNESLCRSIALGHDLGHPPFGHLGEGFLSKVSGRRFHHGIFGVVVAQFVERGGRGLNLTHQTLKGILDHSRGSGYMRISGGSSEEATLVMYADKISYVWADINDLFLRGYLKMGDYPELQEAVAWFGRSQRERTQECIRGLCLESAEKGRISFQDSETARKFAHVRRKMYDIYEREKLNYEHLPAMLRVYSFLGEAARGVDPAVAFALLSDSDVLALAADDELTAASLKQTSAAEILPHLRNRGIDFTDPRLDW